MKPNFADRILDVPKSFIREILKVAANPEVISFAGGLPNKDLFPVTELKNAAFQVFENEGNTALQYSNSEGCIDLRNWISQRYQKRKGLSIDVNELLITSGSQQGLDLMAKAMLNEGDDIIIEKPGYLGAIQSFAIFNAQFNLVTLEPDGLNLEELENTLKNKKIKLIYLVPNFQNPSGITYSNEKRAQIAKILKKYPETFLIEDDPYGELRFSGEDQKSFKHFLPNQCILLGSFSKIAAPGMRIGWIHAPIAIMEKLLIAKQAADLHTNYLSQRILVQYFKDNDIDDHIQLIKNAYGSQRQKMLDCIREYFPPEMNFTLPEGGMFLWLSLAKNFSSMQLFDIAIQKKVAFVPGNPFYPDNQDSNTLRLNFSCADLDSIELGIKRLAEAIEELYD